MKETKPYPKFPKEKETEIFKALAHKSYRDVGKDFGIEGEDAYITAVVFSIARKIKKAPELWGISQETKDVIQQGMDSRSVKKNPKIKSEVALLEESFRDKLDTIRDTVADIIKKKLNKGNTNKGIDYFKLSELKDLLATAIDKSRLLRGESTENIIKMAKIDVDNLKPEDAMAVIMKARDLLIDNKK